MAVQPEGTPCWADAMFSDVEGAKRFYGDVLGWTFGETSSEYGNYTQAYADGKAVAAVVPPMPGQEGQSQWCLYFASPDVAATAERIRENGGEVLMEPMQVGEFGTMCPARELQRSRVRRVAGGHPRGLRGDGHPRRLLLGRGLHQGAGTGGTPSSPPSSVPDEGDRGRRGGLPDVRRRRGHRARPDADDRRLPPEVPSYINVYFTVDDCDAAVDRAIKLGGVLRFGLDEQPFGRFAALSDLQGANFSVIDITTTEGEMPRIKDRLTVPERRRPRPWHDRAHA